jgi:ribosomal-protein-alanine N-acetyltransferase
MPSFPDLAEPLNGPGVRVRLATERDIPEILIAHQDDPSLHARLGLARPPSGAELGRRTEEQAADRASGTGVWLTILGAESDDCRGQLDVHRVDWDHQRAELGIWIAPRERGHGLASGALVLAGRWLLATCGLMRIELFTEPDNEPMGRAAGRAGFVEEGVLRGYLRERGARVDVTVMSLIAADLEPA